MAIRYIIALCIDALLIVVVSARVLHAWLRTRNDDRAKQKVAQLVATTGLSHERTAVLYARDAIQLEAEMAGLREQLTRIHLQHRDELERVKAVDAGRREYREALEQLATVIVEDVDPQLPKASPALAQGLARFFRTLEGKCLQEFGTSSLYDITRHHAG